MSKKSEYVRKHRRENAAYVRQLKDVPCVDCGGTYPYWVMQFDHVRGEKEFTLSKVTQTNISRKRIDAEMNKCDIVCANCHALRHMPSRILENSPEI